MFNKKIEKKCKNCKLYDSSRGECRVIILFEGQKINVPVAPDDECLYEQDYFNPLTKSVEKFSDDIKEVKFWVENEKGEKIDGNGIVKMEYPEGFFSPLD
jgi:dipeptidase